MIASNGSLLEDGTKPGGLLGGGADQLVARDSEHPRGVDLGRSDAQKSAMVAVGDFKPRIIEICAYFPQYGRGWALKIIRPLITMMKKAMTLTQCQRRVKMRCRRFLVRMRPADPGMSAIWVRRPRRWPSNDPCRSLCGLTANENRRDVHCKRAATSLARCRRTQSSAQLPLGGKAAAPVRGAEGADRSLTGYIRKPSASLAGNPPLLRQRRDRMRTLLLKWSPALTLDAFMTGRHRISAGMHGRVGAMFGDQQLQLEAGLRPRRQA